MYSTRDADALYHFPAVYEGGCIYDILARYHAQSLHLRNSATSKELFGRVADLRPSITLPYHVERIYVWLGLDSNISAQTLRDRHSAWQFLQLTEEFSEGALAPITRAEIRPGRRKQTRMRLVLQKGLRRLRYCPLCLIKDALTVGEPFWHQVHQLYGVRYCPVHCIPLQDSTVNIEKPLYRYVPASTLLKATSTTQLMTEAACLEEEPSPYKGPYVNLARTINWLLAHGLELGNDHGIEARYKSLLDLSDDMPLEGKQLVALMISIGGREFLRDLYGGRDLDELLGAITKEGVKALSPLEHALVVTALQIPNKWGI